MNHSFKGMKTLITGGLGFIGSNLAIRLVELGAQVTLVDSLIPEYGGNLWNIEPVKGQVRINISDVRDEHAMKYLIQGQDFLFNLAGQTSHLDSMQNPYPDLEINARAQLSILEACRHHNPAIKLVFASTRQMYGAPQYLPVDEKHPLAPVDINGINKMAGEWYHLVYNNVYGIRASVLRLTNTYGPRMRVKDARQTFLGIWIKNILTDKPVLVFGDGKQIRDFNYVDDVVEAMLLCAASDAANGEIFNLGADDPVDLQETARLLVQTAGQGSFELVLFPPDRKAIDIGDYYADFRKIKASLSWQPAVMLNEGLKRTLDFYRADGHHYWEAADHGHP
jgi:UDP-glucose 4-epimerase